MEEKEIPKKGWSRPAIAVAVLTVLYAGSVFWGLGGMELWGDEGIIALGGKRVAQFGYPKAWDGRNLFSWEAGYDLNENLLQVHLPWMGFYASGLGQWLFGSTAFGARFMFALCGILNLPLLYLVGKRLQLPGRTCLFAVMILASLPSYFLYIRQCYHYAADVTLVLLAVLAFLCLQRRWGPILLAVITVLLFHFNHLTPLWMATALTAWAIWEGQFLQLFRRPATWVAFCIALAGTYGWIRWAKTMELQESLGGWSTFLPHWKRLAFVTSELDMSFPILLSLPVVVCVGYLSKNNLTLSRLLRMSVCFLIPFFYFASYEYAWLRFFIFTFFIFALLWAVAIHWVSVRSPKLAMSLAILLFATTLPYQLSHGVIGRLWPSFSQYEIQRMPMDPETGNAMGKCLQMLSPALIEIPAELASPAVTPMAEVNSYLRQNAQPNDLIVSLCDSEAIQFLTGLTTAYLIDPRQPTASKVSHLPSYLTSYADTKWLLLRNMWRNNYGMRELNEPDQNQIILQSLKRQGCQLDLVPLRVRERFPNQLPMLWGRTWSTDIGQPTMQLYRVSRPPLMLQRRPLQ